MANHNITKYLIDKMLEGKSSYQYVLENPKINNDDWYNHFQWTQTEQNAYTKWAIAFLAKKTRLGKKIATREINLFITTYGLKLKPEE